MKNLKSLTEIVAFLESVLGKTAAETFDENMEDYVYFVRTKALHDMDISETKMRGKLRKYADLIIMASVRQFLNEHYADDTGEVEINMNEDGVFDRNINKIEQIEQIRKSQREMMTLIVSRGMLEFAKGRRLARIMENRSVSRLSEQSPKDANWMPTYAKSTMLEQTEIEILRLERKLPNVTPEEAKRLSELYALLRSSRQPQSK